MGHEVLTHDGLPSYLSDYTFTDAYRVPLMRQAPTIDGFVDEAEWKCAAGFDGFSLAGELGERKVRAYFGATQTHFYFAIVSEMPPTGELLTAVTAHTDRVVWDDAIEVWIDPTPGTSSGVEYQVLANSAGVDAYQVHARGRVKPDEVYGWKGDYKIANGIHDGFWHCEIEVPIEKVAPGRKATEGRWGLNLTRDFKQPWEFGAIGNHGFNPQEDIVFTFAEEDCAAIQLKQYSDLFTRTTDVGLSIYNPGTTPMTFNAQIFLKRNLMPEVQQDVQVTVAGGETQEVRLFNEDPVSHKFSLFAIVREPNGGPYHFSRYFKWGPPREARWDAHKRERLPVEIKFAYYPYKNRMRVQTDVTALPAEATLASIDYTLREKESKKVIRQWQVAAGDFTDQLHEITFELPPLAGEYEIAALVAGENVPDGEFVKEFQRNVYEWEHSNAGKSRTVYPPFTPITVDGQTLHTVMKEYDLNACGLLDQARSMDQQGIALKEILAGPMRYRATINGKEVTASAAQLSFTEQADDVVIAQSAHALGALNCATTSTLEYDGMLRVDLTLSPTAGTVESLDLEIPVKDEVAKLMHAMSEALRYPIFTGSAPGGDGVVWTAAELSPTDWPVNFCTYIFLGDAARGICWFTENDRGWSWDPEKPNMSLIRKDGVLTICVHLINKPLAIDAPRTITFGVQASPVKPRMDGWRHSWWTDKMSIIGCDRHWFSLGDCGAVYPAGRDLYLWEMLARGTRERISDEEVEKFIEYGKKYYEPYSERDVADFVEMATLNLRNRYGMKTMLYYNRSTTGDCEEYHTFIDEWGLKEYNDRDYWWPAEVKIVPPESYIDFALYWFGKSFDTGVNCGIYLDNNFFVCDYNREMTAAYRKEDGKIMPSTGIWGLRDLAKRSFVYLNERGMPPINLVHTTSTQILPANSFYTVQYDWEWHFSEGDVHDRFDRRYLLTVSNGEHLGALPLALHEQGKCVYDPWTYRTYLGVTIIHELVLDPYVWDVEPIPEGDTPENRMFATFREPILEMCRKPDTVVYRYWDQRPQPIVATHPELLTIVYARNGIEAICAITSYADQDEVAVVTIDPAPLGLTAGYQAIDAETGEQLVVTNNTITFPLNRHDLKEFKLVAK